MTPRAPKELIDEASRITPPDARTHIDAFLTVYWFAIDEPDAAVQASKNLALEDIPVVGAEIAWVLAQIYADAGRATEAVAAAEAGHAVATRSLDAPHMRFNIADAEVSALLLSGQVADAIDIAERTRRQAANLPGAAAITRCCRGRSGRAWRWRSAECMPATGTGSRRVVRVASHRLGIPLSRSPCDGTRDAGIDSRGSRRARRARRGATPTSFSGLRAEPGPGVGGCRPGRGQ